MHGDLASLLTMMHHEIIMPVCMLIYSIGSQEILRFMVLAFLNAQYTSCEISGVCSSSSHDDEHLATSCVNLYCHHSSIFLFPWSSAQHPFLYSIMLNPHGSTKHHYSMTIVQCVKECHSPVLLFAVYTPMYIFWVTFIESGILQR